MSRYEEFIEINGKSVMRLPDAPENGDGRKNIFIVGSKGIPALYGGFETFVEKLTEYRVSDKLRYHVARVAEDKLRYMYNGAECFDVKVPDIGAARAVWYDIAALKRSIRMYRGLSGKEQPVFYVLACRIGPFIGHFKRKIKKLGGVLYVNPDGHEWKRGKWNRLIQRYWKLSEKLMVKHADLLICDSVCIEKYIHEEYAKYNPQTVFIAYGADNDSPTGEPSDGREKYAAWLDKTGVSAQGYYLAVSRFVPENNFETMIREFMRSDTEKDFVIITTRDDAFSRELERKLHFSSDRRIKFAEPVYDSPLLKEIRANAYAYLHGHEVGGTNPTLLEALDSTKLNLLLDVGFNREVALDTAFYWTKEAGSLSSLIEKADKLTAEDIDELGAKAKKRIYEAYRWENIADKYEKLFLNGSV